MTELLVEYACRQVARHPSVRSIEAPVAAFGTTTVEFELDLSLGHRWVAQGASPSGIRPVERVRLDFGPLYPTKAPGPSYRADLGRGFPHVQPWLTPDGRPVPCLTEAPIDDFHAVYGLHGLIDQFVAWLQRAASGALIDPQQGWEVSRRDGYIDSVLVDVAAIRKLPDAQPGGRFGYAYLQTRFAAHQLGKGGPGSWLGEVGDLVKLDDASLGGRATQDVVYGEGVCLAVWATAGEDEPAPVFPEYEPDDVETYADLMAKAERLKVSRRLGMYLDILTNNAPYGGNAARLPVVVLMLVRRPLPLAGSDSDIEVFAYSLPLTFPCKRAKLDPETKVDRLAVRDRLSRQLLRRVSGGPEVATRWALIGAGSLGSKIGIHLARQGVTPIAVTDKSQLLPHNVARHGLLPTTGGLGLEWRGPKSSALVEAIASIVREPLYDLPGDATEALMLMETWADRPEVIVNTTASLALRAGAAQTPSSARWIDAELFDRASLGTLRVEGPDRNPSIEELAGVGYATAARDESLAQHIFEGAGVSRLALGEGCGSSTMIADDARLSVQAAAMAESIGQHLAQMPAEGLVQTWRRDGGGLSHETTLISPFFRLALADGWTLSIAPTVSDAIDAEVGRWPKSETGGVLIGRVSFITRTIYALDTMQAPSDSKRSPSFFELGVAGLAGAIADLSARTGGALYCVGTWHSHLGAANPSQVDRATAAKLGKDAAYPLALLIRGRDGYQGVFAGYREEGR